MKMHRPCAAKALGILITCLQLLGSAGCCKAPKAPPKHPGQVAGWKDSYINTTHFIADLVLKKGESSDNGKVGVRVAGVIKPEVRCGTMPEPDEPKANIQFYSPATGEVLCAFTTGTGNRVLDCDSRVAVYVIGVKAINADEGWVHFDLRE